MCPLFRTKLSLYHVRWIVSFSSTMRRFLIMHVASSWTRGEIHFLKCLKIHHMDESSSPIPTISTAQSEKIFIINNWVKSKNNFHCPVHLARACWSLVVDCQPTSSLGYTNKHIGSMSDDFSFRRCSRTNDDKFSSRCVRCLLLFTTNWFWWMCCWQSWNWVRNLPRISDYAKKICVTHLGHSLRSHRHNRKFSIQLIAA